MKPEDFESDSEFKAACRSVALDARAMRIRQHVADYTSEVFSLTGQALHVIGHVFGDDRKSGTSPFNHGSDEVVGVSLLLRIAGQLTGVSSKLFTGRQSYAAAALLRQIVEIEYLAWAFAQRDKDAERWLRSTYKERESIFRPGKLRSAADGRFRGKDYEYHCELGGHPVPGASILFQDSAAIDQLLLSDLLGHTSSIWNYLLEWAGKNVPWSAPFAEHCEEMQRRYKEWKETDKLVELPAPP